MGSWRRHIVLAVLGLGLLPGAALADPTGPQAFNGERVSGANPDEAPKARPAPYSGTPLTLSYSYVGRDAVEPTIAIDRTGTIFYAAGFFDSTIPSLARQELRRSRDGGMSWDTVQAPFGTGGGEVFTLDPFVVGDNASNRIFAITLLGAGSYLAYSDDSGQTWTESAVSSPGVNDHQTLTAIRPPENFPPSSDPAFPNYVYYCVNHVSDARCTRSSDGGQTFQPTGSPPYLQSGEGMQGQDRGICSALHGHLRGDSEGRLLLPAGHCGAATLAVSEDAGLTWRRSIVSQTLRSAGVHTAVAVDKADNIYYVWMDSKHRLPYMAVSTDHGESWGEPIMIAPPGVVEANFPVAVAGEPGRVAINFPGGTGAVELANPPDGYNAQDQRPWFTYMVQTTNALDPDPLFLSNTAGPAGDPVHRGDCGPGRCDFMFDFMDIITSPVDGSVWGTATDTCTDEGSRCVSDPVEGRPRDAEGVAVRISGGPRLIGEGDATPGGGGPTSPGTSKPSPSGGRAPSASKVRLRCVGRKRRCSVRLAGAPGGTGVSLRLYRGERLLAGGSTRLKAGKGKIKLRKAGRKVKLRKGRRYTALVTVSRRGAQATRAERRIKMR